MLAPRSPTSPAPRSTEPRASGASGPTSAAPVLPGRTGPERPPGYLHPCFCEGCDDCGQGSGTMQTTPDTSVAFGKVFKFEGKTNATYTHNWTQEGDSVQGKTHTGTLAETFSVATRVSLPPVPSGLTECEQPIVDRAINVTLAAHEQEHVTAFETYNGTVNTPYSINGSSAQVIQKLGAMHTTNHTARKAASDALSAALDPFFINVDTSSCDPKE